MVCLFNSIQNSIVSTERDKVRWKGGGGGGISNRYYVSEAYWMLGPRLGVLLLEKNI